MSKVQTLRAFVQQRLSAAAEEIFELFERTIAEYEEELCGQRKLLDAVFKPEVRLHRADVQLLLVSKEEVPPEQLESSPSVDQEDPPERPHIKEERSPSLDQEDPPERPHIKEGWSPSLDQEDPPEPPHIKEERGPSLDQEDPPERPHIKEGWSPSLDQEDPPEPPYIKEEKEGDQLRGLENADITKFLFTPVPVKSEEDNEETPQSSQLHQRLTEQMKRNPDGEDCGPEPDRNSDPERHLQPATDDKTSHSSETDDSCDWEETRKPQSGSKPLQSGCNTDEKPFGCSECGKQFNHNSTLRRHMRFHTVEKPIRSFSSKRFIQRVSLTHHMTLRKGEKHRQDCGGPEPVRNSDPEGYLQPDTDDKTSHSFERKTDNSCYLEETREPQSGSNPLQNNEVSERDQECSTVKTSSSSSECATSSGHKGRLQKRKRMQTVDKLFSCSVCKKSFSDRRNLSRHMKIHTGEKPFSCSVCGKTYVQKEHLRQHMAIHTGEKSYGCSTCGKAFAQKSQLRRHMAIHTGEKPFSCSLCDKTFAQKSHLKPHMAIHTGEKPFSCSICGKAFARAAHLQPHMAIHTGEKPFSCSLCDKTFAQKSHLRPHMAIHTGRKAVSCSLCGKTFAFKTHLRQHLISHRGETL
ncbi:gastrula zinc finger protein XlCGF26.1-like isoform X1 [Micropterus dolomieu]|uniref:gastrula zinc finger protein XlCGF26.1-like isoform X1 n=1 Tax=Micropterus dolomieu TaxID=147949 RepID=UPI001E8DFC8F|nr:gastrula zinc finger protein XlCGF26.1-like isoform X1 [Micropterus dolomieu]